MKKSYIAPQTEAMEILANNVLMASPGGYVDPHIGMGTGSYNGAGE